MNDSELEDLLRAHEGPQPRAQTTEAILALARQSQAARVPAGAVPVVFSSTPRHNWRRWAAGLAAACVLAAVLLWLQRPAGLEPARLAAVLSEQVQVQRNGRAVRLKREDWVVAGDEVLSDQLALLQMNDGSQVKLAAGTRVVLEAPAENQRVHLRLAAGRIFVRAAKAPAEFVISASATVRVVGTTFGVDEASATTTVNVLEGRVAVSADGLELPLARGQSAQASAGEAPKLLAADVNDALRWAREYIKFERRALGEVLDWIADNSSYRFEVSEATRARKVNLTVLDEPMRQIIETLLLACSCDYRIQDDDIVIVREP